MIFQSEVNSNIQALGNAGQIAKGYHSYCNVVDYVAGENISVGEFAQSVANNDNEAKSTAGKQVTGSILGVLVFTEGKTALITNLEYDTNKAFCANPSSWWNNTVARRPEAHAATNDGGNALGWWEDYMPYYRAAAIADGKVDDLDDSAKYPAFHAAIAKGEGWFVPSAYALVNVMNNSDAINATLNTLGKTQLTGEFWTATAINIFGVYWRNYALSPTRDTDRATGVALQKVKENDVGDVHLNYTDRIEPRNVLAVKAVNLK